MLGKPSSTELRSAIASGGVFLLPTCPWTPSASEKPERLVPYDTESQGHEEVSPAWEERGQVPEALESVTHGAQIMSGGWASGLSPASSISWPGDRM